jgi:hypothetical protein
VLASRANPSCSGCKTPAAAGSGQDADRGLSALSAVEEGAGQEEEKGGPAGPPEQQKQQQQQQLAKIA